MGSIPASLSSCGYTAAYGNKDESRIPGAFTFSLNVGGISPKGDLRENDQAMIVLETDPDSEDDGV